MKPDDEWAILSLLDVYTLIMLAFVLWGANVPWIMAVPCVSSLLYRGLRYGYRLVRKSNRS
jgi:hypothetical protein